uniref:Uncharacterized protein n=1 Tax=Lactuca sativa TaxID=4236 RepID=A0A9R1VV98_LACSA|nr:hypothetical protein LSAT_V11C400222650 [Lactuca sativa]
MSEISVEDEVDCSKFMKHETENEKPLISEKSFEFARLSKEQKPKLKEKALVYQKVQTVPNQVYAVTGVTQRQMAKLRIIVDKDNAEGCEDYFWSAPIDNADETVGVSDKTTWRVKGRYLLEPINKPSIFDIPSSSGTKDVPEEPMVEPDVPIKREEPKSCLGPEPTFGPRPRLGPRPRFGPQPRFGPNPSNGSSKSQVETNSLKDIKGKEKLVSDPEKENKKSSSKPRKIRTPTDTLKFKEDKTKIKVYTIKRKDETTLIKRTFLVDISTVIPFSMKNSPGPKKLWVPKSA